MRTAYRSGFPVSPHGMSNEGRRDDGVAGAVGAALGTVIFVGLLLGTFVWLGGLLLVDADVLSRSLSWWTFVRLASLFHLCRALVFLRPKGGE